MYFFRLLFISLSLFLLPLSLFVPGAQASEVHHLHLEGVINPIKVRYIENGIRAANEADAAGIVISINTPGGMVDSMEKIIGSMLNSGVPVITFVEPRGASATSAGTFILLAGDVAAMAPGTTIGSAHPVGGQGEEIEGEMKDKIVNHLVSRAKSLAESHDRNVDFAIEAIRSSMNLTAEDALETGVIELIAEDVPDLLSKLDGFVISHNHRQDTITLAGLPVQDHPMSKIEQFLDALANPSIAYILMTLGVMGLIYEFSNPGIGLGAVLGSICLLLGLIALAALPIHMGGILLIILGFIMLVLDLKISSGGLLTVGGVIALVLGSFFFVDAKEYYGAVQEIKYAVVIPIVVTISLLAAACLSMAVRALTSPQVMGVDAMVGMPGAAKTVLDPHGSVFVDGALWKAESASGKIEKGTSIVVRAVLGSPRRLKVEPDEGGADLPMKEHADV